MLSNLKINQLLKCRIFNNYKRLLSQVEFQVTPFCKIDVDSHLNINIRPLDLFKYHNCDQVIIKSSEDDVEYAQKDDQIIITSKKCGSSTGNCNIIAPVKASEFYSNVFL